MFSETRVSLYYTSETIYYYRTVVSKMNLVSCKSAI